MIQDEMDGCGLRTRLGYVSTEDTETQRRTERILILI